MTEDTPRFPWVLVVGLLLIAMFWAWVVGCGPMPAVEAPLAPPRTDISPSGLRIKVAVYRGDLQPYCSMPDAGDETRCEFYWGWLQHGSMLTVADEGWRGLTPRGARQACREAMFSLGTLATYEDVRTCAFLLLYIHNRDLPPDDTPPEAQ